jgi:lipoprotein-releasing system permease protein
MSVRLLLFLARRSLFSSRITVALLALSIAAGTGFQIANTANLDAFGASLVEDGLTHGTGDVRVEPSDAVRFRDGDAMAAQLRSFTGVRDAVPVLVYAGAVGKAGKRFLGAPIYGLDPQSAPPFHLSEGTALPPGDTGGILLGTSLAKRLEVKVGDTIETRVIFGAPGLAVDDDSVGSYSLKLRGIVAGSAGAYRFAFLDRSFLAKESGEPKAASVVLVHLADHEAAKRVADEMNAKLPDVLAIGWREDDPYLPNYLGANHTISTVSYAMVIAAVSVPMWALLYIHVLKRRREIALMSALGFRRAEIFTMFLLQALVVALLGCAIGALLGGGLIAYFHGHPLFQWDTLIVRPVFTLAAFLGPMLVLTATALVAGSYPAWRAARTDPALVLRGLE